jgi:hypothetical protein
MFSDAEIEIVQRPIQRKTVTKKLAKKRHVRSPASSDYNPAMSDNDTHSSGESYSY